MGLSTAGALSNHLKTHAKPTVTDRPISLLLMQQIEWANSQKAEEEQRKEEQRKASASRDESGSEGEEEELAKDGRRGRPRRLRVSVKYKMRVIKLFDDTRTEMMQEAEELQKQVPNSSEVIDRLAKMGLVESKSNVYHWLQKREKISSQYAADRYRKLKTIGSGRHALLPKTEVAVKQLIVERREANLRVPRSFVKAKMKELAVKLEPEQESKVKWSRKLFRGAFKRMHVVVRRISSTKAMKNDEAALLGRFFCHELMHLRQFGFSLSFPDQSWLSEIVCDSVYGYFHPDFVFAADEVPFNFADTGRTIALVGDQSAVRTLRQTGKRFGTCVVICDASGRLLQFVLIFKVILYLFFLFFSFLLLAFLILFFCFFVYLFIFFFYSDGKARLSCQRAGRICEIAKCDCDRNKIELH